MSNETKKNISFLIVISGRKQKDSLVAFLVALDAGVVNVSYGKGSVKPTSPLVEIFGFVPEEHKAVITCLLSQKKAHEVLEKLEQKFSFNKLNTGIAFSVNIDNLSF